MRIARVMLIFASSIFFRFSLFHYRWFIVYDAAFLSLISCFRWHAISPLADADCLSPLLPFSPLMLFAIIFRCFLFTLRCCQLHADAMIFFFADFHAFGADYFHASHAYADYAFLSSMLPLYFDCVAAILIFIYYLMMILLLIIFAMLAFHAIRWLHYADLLLYFRWYCCHAIDAFIFAIYMPYYYYIISLRHCWCLFRHLPFLHWCWCFRYFFDISPLLPPAPFRHFALSLMLIFIIADYYLLLFITLIHAWLMISFHAADDLFLPHVIHMLFIDDTIDIIISLLLFSLTPQLTPFSLMPPFDYWFLFADACCLLFDYFFRLITPLIFAFAAFFRFLHFLRLFRHCRFHFFRSLPFDAFADAALLIFHAACCHYAAYPDDDAIIFISLTRHCFIADAFIAIDYAFCIFIADIILRLIFAIFAAAIDDTLPFTPDAILLPRLSLLSTLAATLPLCHYWCFRA